MRVSNKVYNKQIYIYIYVAQSEDYTYSSWRSTKCYFMCFPDLVKQTQVRERSLWKKCLLCAWRCSLVTFWILSATLPSCPSKLLRLCQNSSRTACTFHRRTCWAKHKTQETVVLASERLSSRCQSSLIFLLFSSWRLCKSSSRSLIYLLSGHVVDRLNTFVRFTALKPLIGRGETQWACRVAPEGCVEVGKALQPAEIGLLNELANHNQRPRSE